MVGFVGSKASRLKHLSVDLKNEFAAVTLTSLDAAPISSSRNLLLVATAGAGMSGMKWTEGKTKSLDKGNRPVTIEVVEGTVTLSGLGKARSVTMTPLDGAGNPIRQVTHPVRKGKAVLELGKDVTVWYSLKVAR